MKLVSFACAVLLSVLSASAFGQGQSLDQREANIAARKAALAEKQRLADEEADLVRQEEALAAQEAELAKRKAALAQGQTAQPAQAAPAAQPGFFKRSLNKLTGKDAGEQQPAPQGAKAPAAIGLKDKLFGQIEVAVWEVEKSTVRVVSDADGETRYCSADVLDRKVTREGEKAKVKKKAFAECSTRAPATVASSSAPTDYVSLRGPAVQTAQAAASNGGTAVSVTLSRGGMVAIEMGGTRRPWKCAPTAEDRQRPGTKELVAWTANWSAKDFADRGCKEMPRQMMAR